MELKELTFSFGSVQWLVTFAIGIYAWFVGRQAASAKELMELRARLIEIEVQMKQVPSQATMAAVLARLERLDAFNEGNAKELKAINSNLNRINDYLLNQRQQ